MSFDIQKHGKEILRTGGLTWTRNSRAYRDGHELNYLMEWPQTSDVFSSLEGNEEIFMASAKKSAYKSSLHFGWRIYSYYREIDTKSETEELIAQTDFSVMSHDRIRDMVKKSAPGWWARYHLLFPSSNEVTVIYNDTMELYFVFEESNDFIGWYWTTNA